MNKRKRTIINKTGRNVYYLLFAHEDDIIRQSKAQKIQETITKSKFHRGILDFLK